MDTIRGEPDWVNWSQKTWAREELMQDAATVGASINDELNSLIDWLPGTVETWSMFYDQLEPLEQFHQDVLVLVERARSLGLTRINRNGRQASK